MPLTAKKFQLGVHDLVADQPQGLDGSEAVQRRGVANFDVSDQIVAEVG